MPTSFLVTGCISFSIIPPELKASLRDLVIELHLFHSSLHNLTKVSREQVFEFEENVDDAYQPTIATVMASIRLAIANTFHAQQRERRSSGLW